MMSFLHLFVLSIFAGVTGVPEYDDGAVRLVGGSTSLEGRVEVYYQGSWGTVCDDYWDVQDATVVCNQLMPGYNAEDFHSAHFGEGAGDILLDDVSCDGTEANLLGCPHPGNYNHNCRHSEDAGVRCYRPASDGDIQLVGGGAPHRGRVEVFHGSQWGTVCDDAWDLDDATVVCRQLGYTGATSALQRAYYGEGSGPILLDDLYCIGFESRLVDCPGANFYEHNCRHYEDASVICTPPVDGDARLTNGTSGRGRVEIFHHGEWWAICASDWTIEDSTATCKQLGYSGAQELDTSNFGSSSNRILNADYRCGGDETSLSQCEVVYYDGACNGQLAAVSCDSPDDGDIRLVGGGVFSEGRVEIYYQSHWGTVCDDRWDINDASVVCRQLGYPGAVEAMGMAYFGQGSTMIHLDEVQCSGSESRLTACDHLPWTQHDCSHYEDASVRCEHNQYGDVRLADGSSRREGRVEIWIDDRGWMSVCDYLWDENEGEVVCRQLGFEGVVQVTHQSSFGGGTGDIFATNIACSGQEDALTACHRDEIVSQCTHDDDAGVVCALPDGRARLVDGSVESEGRVEIFHDNSWWNICGYWSEAETNVLCRELGFTGYSLYLHSFGPGSWGVMDHASCSWTDATLMDCIDAHAFENNYGCTHDTDVGVVCDETKFVSGAVRLVNGNVEYAGRVEIFTGERWGSLCDVAFDIEDAHVICRQVGYRGASAAKKGAFFGMNSYRVVSTGYDCQGTELTLYECPLAHGTLLSDCTHDNDSSVICEPEMYYDFSVELVGNATYQSSRVSVFHEGQWKSVCSDNWDWRDAAVACRHAGYVGATYTIEEDAYVDFQPMVFTAHQLACEGHEYDLRDCPADWESTECASNTVASVRCATSYEDVLQDGDIRLTNGTSSKDGQVEMFRYGIWEPVCGDEWHWEEASVACRQLGFLGAISSHTVDASGYDVEYSVSGIDCSGEEWEQRLTDCLHSTIATRCPRVGAAVCALTYALLPQIGDVRLIPLDEENPDSGIITVFVEGVWGKICADDFTWAEANVVCTQLHYYGAIEAITARMGGMDDEFGFHQGRFDCEGYEGHVIDCRLEVLLECDSANQHAAGVNCTHHYQEIPFIGKARLIGEGDGGHVEVFINNDWGLVCGDSWTYQEAKVVCTHLGYNGVIASKSLLIDDFDPDDISMTGVECGGMEYFLTDCLYSPADRIPCLSVAYVECSKKSDELARLDDIEIRLADGFSLREGRVEVYVLGRWGSICDDMWTFEDAAVVCRHLGYTDADAYTLNGGYYGPSYTGMVYGHPVCSGWESRLEECSLQSSSSMQCWNRDVGVNCAPRAPVVIIVIVVVVVLLLIIIVICIGCCCYCNKKSRAVIPPTGTVPAGLVAQVPIAQVPMGQIPVAQVPFRGPSPLPPVMEPTAPVVPGLQYTKLPSMQDVSLPPGVAPPPPTVVYVPPPN